MTSYHYNQDNQNLGTIEQDANGTWWAIDAEGQIRCDSEQHAQQTLTEIHEWNVANGC